MVAAKVWRRLAPDSDEGFAGWYRWAATRQEDDDDLLLFFQKQNLA